MTWSRGRDTIERLLAAGELERVPPSPAVAGRLLEDAEAHIALARKGVADGSGARDAAGALQLAYDAARKTSAALLAVQGLRSTTRGGHVAVLDAVRDQFDGPGGAPVFGRTDRYRRRRNDSDYPDPASPGVTKEDAVAAIRHAVELLESARQLLHRGGIDAF